MGIMGIMGADGNYGKAREGNGGTPLSLPRWVGEGEGGVNQRPPICSGRPFWYQPTMPSVML